MSLADSENETFRKVVYDNIFKKSPVFDYFRGRLEEMDRRMQHTIERTVEEELDGNVLAAFIGGPLDGTVRELPPHTREWRAAAMPPQYSFFDGSDKIPDLPEYKTVTYVRDDMLILPENPHATVFWCCE